MEVVLVLIVGLLIIFSFSLGVSFGQKLSKNEPIDVHPIKTFKEIIPSKPATEDELLSKELENIDNYDGTGLSQREL